MINDIQATITDFEQRDKRTDFYRLEIADLEGNDCVLAGSVLDGAALTELGQALQARFPSITFDLERVTVLSQTVPRMAIVSVNTTAVLSNPSWASETMSEVLNGWSVEILMERERWAFTRQADGYLGWVYRPYLMETAVSPPTHMVYEPISLLYAQPDADAELVGRVFSGTAVFVTKQSGQWLHIELAGGLSGWILQTHARRLADLPTDTSARRETIITNARRLMGVPYLWGGGTANGLDCSGFSQMLYRLAGVTIPRDADMQFDAGMPVEPSFEPGDLLYFGGSKDGHRAISHVGISLGGWQMIHASRGRNGVYIDDVQVATWLMDMYLGARTFLVGGE